MHRNKRIACYARVSTNDQSTEMQRRDLREFARARGFEVFAEYEDVGVSGATKSRPSLDRLMADARKRKFKAVLVWRFDRFARSTQHLVGALAEFRSLGIDFISYNENIDTSSPIGEAIFTIISAMAQLERDIIRERVKAGLVNAKAKGKKLGRPRSINSEKVIELRSQGKSLNQIARALGITKGAVSKTLSRTKPRTSA